MNRDAGVEHTCVSLVKSAVVAAKFLIDAGQCGGCSSNVCLSARRADAVIGPFTPVS